MTLPKWGMKEDRRAGYLPRSTSVPREMRTYRKCKAHSFVFCIESLIFVFMVNGDDDDDDDTVGWCRLTIVVV
jgi:hypothetical protein